MAYQPQPSNLSRASGSIGATKTDISGGIAAQVYGWYIYNPNADAVYVQFFNNTAAGATLGSPYYAIGIPGTAAANVFGPGIDHSVAISIAVTTTRTGTSGPTSTVDYNIFYK